MARQILKGIGVKIDEEPLDVELKQIQSDSLYLPVNEHRYERWKGWVFIYWLYT